MILSLIGPALNATGTTIGRKPISAEKQLYIALWFMATPDSYRYVMCRLKLKLLIAYSSILLQIHLCQIWSWQSNCF